MSDKRTSTVCDDNRIPWEYCECGCHRHEFEVCSSTFELQKVIDEKSGTITRFNVTFYTPGVVGFLTKTFKTQREVNNFILEALSIPEVLKDIKNERDKLNKILDELEEF